MLPYRRNIVETSMMLNIKKEAICNKTVEYKGNEERNEEENEGNKLVNELYEPLV